MKKTYIEPAFEVVEFETEDIMNASGISIMDSVSSWADGWGSTEDW